jgi:hypothetical protein
MGHPDQPRQTVLVQRVRRHYTQPRGRGRGRLATLDRSNQLISLVSFRMPPASVAEPRLARWGLHSAYIVFGDRDGSVSVIAIK